VIGRLRNLLRSFWAKAQKLHGMNREDLAPGWTDRWIRWYNEERPHRALNYRSPVEIRARKLNKVA